MTKTSLKMILISSEGVSYEVEDRYAMYSPYLKAAMVCSGTITVTLDKISNRALKEYITFLEGQVPEMDDEIEKAFDFMGHPNVLRYPLDYWSIKLHDVWVRDNMYRLDLLDDPFYDLVEVPMVHKEICLGSLPKGIYVAGGYALYLAGHAGRGTDTCMFSDIDLFTTNIQMAEKYIADSGHEHRISEHAITLQNRRLISDDGSYFIKELQLILRLYKAPTEIVHGFDLDCCGFLLSYDDGTPRLWATRMAHKAVKSMINWFDPDRMSKAYGYRMAKYMTRGFKPMLPLFPVLFTDPILGSRIRDIENRIEVLYNRLINATTRVVEIMPGVRARGRDHLLRDGHPQDHITACDRLLYIVFKVRCAVRNKDEERETMKRLSTILPMDNASILILSTVASFHTSLWKVHDYDSPSDGPVWRTMDPMSQLDGSFHPEPIKDVIAWYRSSPLLS